MIHTRIQVDPGADVSVRGGENGTVEILILDESGDASAVVNLSPKQLAAICEAASVS